MSATEKSPESEQLLSDVVDERWRYQCPTCACHTLVVRQFHHFPCTYKEVETTMYQQQPPRVRLLRCNECGDTFDRPYDKKRGERRQLHFDT